MGKRAGAVKYRNGDITLGRSGGYWVADWRDNSGARKRTRLIQEDLPEEDARLALDRFADASKAVARTAASHTVGGLWDMWLADRKLDGFKNDTYDAHWVALKPFFAGRAPDLISRQDCRDYARQRFEAGRSASTVHTELSKVRACLRWAHEEKLIGPPPKIWLPMPSRPRERVLTPEEAVALIIAARDHCRPYVHLFTALLFATGGRHKAILDLTWDRINFDRGVIDLDEDIPPDPMNKSWRKGRAEVAMSSMVRPLLEVAYRGRLSDHVIEHGGKRVDSCRKGFASACKHAGLVGVTPHTIRHTCATWLHGKVQTAFTAQLLGHRDEATTRMVYTHADARATTDAVNIITSTIGPLPLLGGRGSLDDVQDAEIEDDVSKVDNDGDAGSCA